MKDIDSPYPRCPEAAAFFISQMEDFCAGNPAVAALDARFRAVGVDILALVDHWTLPETPGLATDLERWGFIEETFGGGAERAWNHPLARLPRVRFSREGERAELALAAEDVSQFLERNNLPATSRTGDADADYETAEVATNDGAFLVVARRGYRGFGYAVPSTEPQALTEIRAAFRTRPRTGGDKEAAQAAGALFVDAAARLGVGRAVEEFFAAERDFYLARNAAARWQYARQRDIGVGWANHDHHTYRSSREGFRPLMRLWRAMGFVFRERFYAGAEAGWGAQILEHPESRVVMFCDVDLSPDELNIDFLETALEPRDSLATIGLWCALHGSSIAEAGMHHVECEFDFTRCEAGFKAAGFGVMKPFTDLPMLKQAFTEPEIWSVPAERLTPLREKGLITDAQADAFARNGAPGSHLEILQRWDGFKGFSKTGVNAIIRETDARRVVGAQGR